MIFRFYKHAFAKTWQLCTFLDNWTSKCLLSFLFLENGYNYYPEFEKTYRCDPDGKYADDYEKPLETGSSRLKIIFKRLFKPSDGREGRGFVIGWTTYKKSPSTVYPANCKIYLKIKRDSISVALRKISWNQIFSFSLNYFYDDNSLVANTDSQMIV